MKIRKLLLTSAIAFAMCSSQAQITITQADMPVVNDNIVISVNTGLSGFKKDSTGANYLWDYSKLIPDSQRYVKFDPASSTPYSILSFISSYGTRNYTPDQFPWALLGSPPTDVYNFYKKSSSDYKMVADGLTVMGNAIPGVYSASDRVYKFPTNYLQKDSSNSAFTFPIPGLGYYAKKQKRVNEVDGWGTLITPFGTFNTLRIKSTLTITDSIYIDTLGFGFTIPRAIAYEYKWLGAGMKIPLLEVDATAAGGNNVTIIRANWRDSLLIPMAPTFTKQNTCPIVNEGSLTVNPIGARYPLTYLWSNGATTSTISNLAPGIYSVTITDRYGRVITVVDSVTALNDSTCFMKIVFTKTKTCPDLKNGALSASINYGRDPLHYLWSTGDTTSSISNLPPGSYTLTVTDKFGRTIIASEVIEGFVQDIACLNIPTAFTPDGDGVNDVWKIRSLSEYTNCKVEIFNQWGSLVFKSTGYTTPWDGRYNGEAVSAGAYYFVIDLDSGSNKFTGTVTIVK